jgi:hypothetical protein
LLIDVSKDAQQTSRGTAQIADGEMGRCMRCLRNGKGKVHSLE